MITVHQVSQLGYSDLGIEEAEECEIIEIFESPGQNIQLIGIGTSLSFRHTAEGRVNRGSMNVTSILRDVADRPTAKYFLCRYAHPTLKKINVDASATCNEPFSVH